MQRQALGNRRPTHHLVERVVSPNILRDIEQGAVGAEQRGPVHPAGQPEGRLPPAQRLGLQPGDVLMRLNDREIKATDDARRVASVPLPWRLQVRRGERVLQIVVGR